MEDIQSLILDEIKDLRNDIKTFQINTESRISQCEVQLETILGNGQPGRLTKVENSLEKIHRFKYWFMGVASVIGGLVSLFFQIWR